MVLDCNKALNFLKKPVGEKWYTSELRAHRLVVHHITLDIDIVMVWLQYVGRKGFIHIGSALNCELYGCSNGRAPVSPHQWLLS